MSENNGFRKARPHTVKQYLKVSVFIFSSIFATKPVLAHQDIENKIIF